LQEEKHEQGRNIQCKARARKRNSNRIEIGANANTRMEEKIVDEEGTGERNR